MHTVAYEYNVLTRGCLGCSVAFCDSPSFLFPPFLGPYTLHVRRTLFLSLYFRTLPIVGAGATACAALLLSSLARGHPLLTTPEQGTPGCPDLVSRFDKKPRIPGAGHPSTMHLIFLILISYFPPPCAPFTGSSTRSTGPDGGGLHSVPAVKGIDPWNRDPVGMKPYCPAY